MFIVARAILRRATSSPGQIRYVQIELDVGVLQHVHTRPEPNAEVSRKSETLAPFFVPYGGDSKNRSGRNTSGSS